jgi:hypothetical protein
MRAQYPRLADKRARVYVLVSVWVVGWAIVHLFLVTAVLPNTILWLSYYAVDYSSGFVRRGLAGELIRIFPFGDYFIAARTVLWSSTVVWLIALAVLIWRILFTGGRSARRIMLALVVPVLPFALSYALYSPHPELFGMTALLAFSMFLTRARTPRGRMILSAVYGVTIAALALMHEAIPLEFAFGATLAIVVLRRVPHSESAPPWLSGRGSCSCYWSPRWVAATSGRNCVPESHTGWSNDCGRLMRHRNTFSITYSVASSAGRTTTTGCANI